jgi:hypothetical protein
MLPIEKLLLNAKELLSHALYQHFYNPFQE